MAKNARKQKPARKPGKKIPLAAPVLGPIDTIILPTEPTVHVPYSDEIAERICDLLTQYSLRKICEMPGMPHRLTVMRWQASNEAFATKCARARTEQADFMDDLIRDTADGTTEYNAQANRVKIDAYKWRAARLKPKKYGEKLDLNVAGQEGGAPIKSEVITTTITDPVEAARLYQEMIAAGKAKV
jgi:hypothetical protein